MSESIYLSKDKFKELQNELATLTKEGRKGIAEKLEFAKSLGDLSENAEYQEARAEQAQLEERIAKLESILKSAQIVSAGKKDAVSVGSSVTIKGPGGSQTWTLVGSEEVDLPNKRISNESPLGSAMMGLKKGDTFSMKTPKGEQEYKITKID